MRFILKYTRGLDILCAICILPALLTAVATITATAVVVGFGIAAIKEYVGTRVAISVATRVVRIVVIIVLAISVAAVGIMATWATTAIRARRTIRRAIPATAALLA